MTLRVFPSDTTTPWKAGTYYPQNKTVALPDGTVRTALVSHTASAAFDPIHWSRPMVAGGVSDYSHAQFTHSNSTSITSLGVLNLPVCQRGDVLTITAYGEILNTSGAGVNVRVDLYVNSVEIIRPSQVTITNDASGNPRKWRAVYEIDCLSSTSQKVGGILSIGSAGAVAQQMSSASFSGPAYATAAMDLSVPAQAKIMGYLGTAHADARITAEVIRCKVDHPAPILTPLNSSNMARSGGTWGVQRGPADHHFSVLPTYDRFEQREDDHWPSEGTTTKQRAEVLTRHHMNQDQVFWISFPIRLEGDPINADTANWVIMGQLHGTPDAGENPASPVLANYFNGGKLSIQTRSDTNAITTGTISPVVRYSDPNPFPFNQWVNLVYKIRTDSTGGSNGLLAVWRDGVNIVPEATIPLGYNDVLGPGWKHGIYRKTVTETYILKVSSNMEISTSDLSDRILNPLPFPPA